MRSGGLKASRLGSCPNLVLLGQLQRQPRWTPDVGFGPIVPSCSWKFFYKREMFQSYQKEKEKKKKKKKHTWIVLCLGGWRCTFSIKATCSPWIKLNIWKHWWKGEQRQIYRIVEEGTEDGSAVVVLIWMSVNLSWKKVNWTSDREKKECKAEAS